MTTKRLWAAASLVALLAPQQGFAAAETCHRTADEKSVFMRALQTDLMVAALTCSSSDQYNTFIHRFQPLLMQDAKQLQSYYRKTHGKAGADELNAFVTHLANDESERSIQQGQAAYCDNATRLFGSVLALETNQVEDFSTGLDISADAPVRHCKPAASTTTASAAPTPTTTVAPAAPTTTSAELPVPAVSPGAPATP